MLSTALHAAAAAALTLACAMWLWTGVLAARVHRSVPRLAELDVPPPARWPALSVISAACNEADTLGPATEARLRSDYPDLELVLVDDRSTDGTGALLDALAARDPRAIVLHVHELPEGWLGKVHAMERGLQASRGEWVLFSDIDVHLSPDALRRAVAFCEARGVDHLAVFPRIEPGGLLRDSAIAAFGRLFTASVRTWEVADPRKEASVGVGAFNLVRRAALERIGGLRRLRLDVADDLALGRLLKHSGARVHAAQGRGAVELTWYRDLPEMARGLEKNLFAYAGRCELWRLVMAASLLVLVDAAPWVALFSGTAWLAALGAAALLTGLVTNAVMARWAGHRVLPALLMPLGTLLLAWIMVRAGVLGRRRGGVLWRGTLYPSELLREAMQWEGGWRGGQQRP